VVSSSQVGELLGSSWHLSTLTNVFATRYFYESAKIAKFVNNGHAKSTGSAMLERG